MIDSLTNLVEKLIFVDITAVDITAVYSGSTHIVSNRFSSYYGLIGSA